jgi:hypothetical protein
MSVEQSFRLPFVLPSFNEIEAAARTRTRNGRSNAYADLKAHLQPAIVGYIRKARLRPLLPGVLLVFTWAERDRRRDLLDIRPACKLVLDALCEPDRDDDPQWRASVIHCDGWHCIRGVIDNFDVDATAPGVRVTLVGRPRVPVAAPDGWPFEVRT